MKPENLTQAAAQHAEVSAIFGQSAVPSLSAKLAEELENVRQERDELQAANNGLTSALNDAQAQVLELTTVVDGLEAQLEETSAKLAAAGANVEELNAEIAALKAATSKKK